VTSTLSTTAPIALDLRRVTARIGAEVRGLDLDVSLEPATVAALRAALDEHKALVFHDVHLDDEGQQRFAAQFGALTSAHPTVPGIEGAPSVLPVDSEQGRANHWHTDVTFVVSPPQISTLRSIVIPPYGGETLVANAGAAYRDLPESLRTLADGLSAVHTNTYDYAVPPEALDEDARRRQQVFRSIAYETVHPVVRVHPRTGERGLFLGGFAQRIVGLAARESRTLLDLLQSYVVRPENILRWRWSPNQLLVFDNRITQHYAVDNYDDLPRRLNRVTVAGDIPTGVNGERSKALAGDASHYTTVAPD
jgi:alpha-ketoglutarate-dependent taurine dioxygenase